MRQDVDDDALHAATLIDIVSGELTSQALGRIATRLDEVVRLSPQSVSARIDLAAILLIQAQQRRDPALILRALDVASEGVQLDSTSPGALYNRALALERLALDYEAGSAWNAYVAAEHDASWRNIGELARERMAAIDHAPTLTAATSSDSLRRIAERFPAVARGFAWETVLGAWANAFMAGDSSRAANNLERATAIGEAIARTSGDVSLVQAVNTIVQAAGTARQRLLADHHARYALALQLTGSSQHVGADSIFTALLADPALSPALRLVVSYAHANAVSFANRPDEAIGLAQSLVRQVAVDEHPSLVGRAEWLTAMIKARRGETDAAAAHLESARVAYVRANDRENVGAVAAVTGEIAKRNGDDVTGFQKLLDGLHTLRAFPSGVWRHNTLVILAGMTARAGLPHAAAAIGNEDFAGIRKKDLPVSRVEATLVMVNNLLRSGRRQAAIALLDSAQHLIEQLPTGARLQLGAESDLLRSDLLIDTDARRALLVLDSALTRLGNGNTLKLARAHVARARARLKLGDVDAAEADQKRAADLYDGIRLGTEDLSQRATLLSSARDVVDGLVAARLAQGRERDALLALEKGRVAFSSRGLHDSDSVLTIQPPREGVAVNYAVVGDSIVAWVIDQDTITTTITRVQRKDLTETTNRVRSGLELRVDDSSVSTDLRRLQDWLIKPLAARLADTGSTVVIIADRELGDVPFAALRDETTGRYFIESHAISYAGTLREASVLGSSAVQGARALLVSASADPDVFPGLAPLPSADAEVTGIASLYDRPSVIGQAKAEVPILTAQLASASVFHFAGHAEFDDVRPDQSRLIIGNGVLTSAAIAAMDLRRLRLVVLSACQTTRVAERRGSGMAGLAEAFLAAGAGGVVGSLWRVDDALTSSLMRTFHELYSTSGDAARALRDAQLQLLHSDSVIKRSPAAWAAFRFVGGQ